jgi:hypothetical protein
LNDRDVIAERVAQSHVDPVRLRHRFLREFDALGAQALVGLSAVASSTTGSIPSIR